MTPHTIDLDTPLPTLLEHVRRTAVAHALALHRGNRLRAAHTLGIARGHLYDLMRRFNLETHKGEAP